MKEKLVAFACGLAVISMLGACQKKEEAPAPAVPQASAPQQGMPAAPEGLGPRGETSVVVPDSVKGQWKGIVILVEDKAAQKTEEYTVDLNSDFQIPGSNLKLSVGDYLPDFKMDGLTITSVSNEPNNPAVRIKVLENEQEIFKGWLYEKFPDVHPFEHEKFSIRMKQGVKKG